MVVVTAAVYSPVVNQGFFNWDDPKHVGAVWKPSWERAWRIVADLDLQYTKVAYYIPLHFLSLMSDQALLGNVEQPYAWISKVINVGYHAANACLVFFLLLALGTRRSAALFGALIFAVHPVQVGTVAWVVERKNVLSTFLYLSAFLVFLRFIRSERLELGVAVVVLFAAGLLSKPSIVTLPVVMLAWLFLLQDRGSFGKKSLAVIGIVLLLALAWGAFVVSTEVSYPGILPVWFMRPLLASAVIWFYVSKFVYPCGFVVMYPRWDVAAHVWEFGLLFAALVVVAAAILYALYRRRVDPALVWGTLFFVVNVLPVSGLAPFGYMGHSFVADHFMYLPLVGLTVVAARAMDSFTTAIRQWPVPAVLFTAAAIALMVVLSVLSFRQVKLWGDPAALWEAALKVNQSSTALYLNYGAVCTERGQLEKALTLFRKAAELSPRYDSAYNNMGRILLALGRKDEAKQMFEKSLQVNPKGSVPRVMLARMLNTEKKPSESLEFLLKSVERDPSNASLRTQLANAYRLLGNEAQAVRELDRAIELAPLAPGPYLSKAHILLTRGKQEEAIALLRTVLSHTSDADAHNMLGAALAQQGNIAEGLEEFRKAYRLKPTLAGVRDNIANALIDLGEFHKAQEFCSTVQKSGMPCSAETLERLRGNLGPK